MSDIAAAAAIAIAQIREPAPMIDAVTKDFAAALRKKPEDIRDKVTAASRDFSTGTLPTRQLTASPVNERMHGLEQLAKDIAQQTNDAEWGEPLVQHFVMRYEELLGVHILRAKEIKDLFYAGNAFRALFEREMPIVISAACAPTDEQAVEILFDNFYDVIVERGLQARVSHVGRFSAMGAQGAAYRAAERVEELERIGVCGPVERFLTMPMAPVHKGALFGKSSGDERWFFREFAQRGVAILLGGDGQAVEEARDILMCAPSRAICCGGFGFESPEDLTELAGMSDPIWLSNASADPSTGRRLGTIVSDIFSASRFNFWGDLLLALAFREDHSGDSIAKLFENAGRQRVVRLVAQTGYRLEFAGVPPVQAWCEVSLLAKELSQRVLEIPNPQSDANDNARWQERAKEAFSATGSRLLMDLDVGQDIHFASWVGIKKPNRLG
jgi:hypothetical protein